MFSKVFGKLTFIVIAALSFFFMVEVGPAGAFSVDVDNLGYTDTSGPRQINYDFLSGTYGVPPLPPNSIGLPETAIIQKNAVDTGFLFGALSEIGNATLILNATSGVATLTTSTEGVAILSGSSSTTPPPPSASWTYSLTLKNFNGVTDAAKKYLFEIGAAVPPPAVAGPQPRFRGEWDSSGNLSLQAAIYDDDTDTSYFSSGVFLTGTPSATSVELKIDNNTTESGKVIFSYRLNGATEWTEIGAYIITGSMVFNSLPARFPYLYISEEIPESSFNVHSHHWYNHATPDILDDTVYNSWLTVDDPGQATYSAVSVNSAGYLAETSLIFNAAGGYWELPAAVFSDNFNDNSINLSDWSASGSSVSESDGVLKVSQVATMDAGGKALSRAFQINPYAPIVVQRKGKVHSADNNFDGVFALLFGDNTGFTTWENDTLSVVVSHANYAAGSAHGFYLGSQPARFQNTFPATSEIWDSEFEEKIVYDPVSGLAELYIDGVQKATSNLGALPAGATYLKVYLDAWGATTGHTNYSDNLSISQKYTGSPVFISNNTPPASPVIFNFTATKKADSTIETISQPITGYVQGFATNLSPTGDITSPTPTFSWTGIAGASDYSVQLSDTNMNRIWNKYDIPPATNSVIYDGPPLESGKTYYYDIVSTIESDGMDNASFAQGSFTFFAAGAAAHPEAATIQSRFEAAMASFNTGDFSQETGFAFYISDSYLDSGETKAQFVAEVAAEYAEGLRLTWTIQNISGAGDYAAIELTWGNGEADTLYFRKENGVWMLYGNQQKYDVEAWSGHTAESYWVSMGVDDPNDAIISISVTGPGISGSINLVHNTVDKRWVSWPIAPPYTNFGPEFGSTPPTPPLTYTFTIADGQGNTPATATVNNFVEVFATPVSPASEETLAALTSFSWIGVGGDYRYRIELNDSSWARLWDSDYDGTTGASLPYTGSALTTGSYSYHLLTENSDGNFSMVTVPFLISTAPPKGDINGDIKVDLADAILALKVMAGLDSSEVSLSGDVNGDGKIGFAELIYILQYQGGVRP